MIIVHAITDEDPVTAGAQLEGCKSGIPKPEGWFASEHGRGSREEMGGVKDQGEGGRRERGVRGSWKRGKSRVRFGIRDEGSEVQGTSADGSGAYGIAAGPTSLIISEKQTPEMLSPRVKKVPKTTMRT